MAERTSSTQIVQIGVEATAGAGGDAGMLLSSLDFTPSVKFTGKLFTPKGRKFGSFVSPGREWTEWKVSGQPTYGEIVYPLNGILKAVDPAADTTLGRLWTFASSLADEDAVETFVLEQGSTVRAHCVKYGVFTEYGLKFTRDSVEQDGTLMAGVLEDGITLTATPTAVEATPVPILGNDVSIYLADSWAGLAAASAATMVAQADWRVTNRFGMFWALNKAKTSWSAVIELVPVVQLKLLMEADATGMGPLTNLRAGSTKWVRIEAEGAEIETGKNYLLQIDGAYNIPEEPGDLKDQDGVFAIEWTMQAVWDATASKAVEVLVRNKLTSL